MTLCPLCTLAQHGDRVICLHHLVEGFEDWHVGNRAMNDFLMRGKVEPREPMTDDEFVRFVEARA